MKNDYYTKAEFSRDYLGKCRTYYNAIKSSNKTVSKTALINCWHKLRDEVKECDNSLQYAINTWTLDGIKERRHKLDNMSRMVLEALIDKEDTKQDSRF